MTPPPQTAAAPRRGRPPTGARERILDAATEVLKADGYAGLTFAKVAARSGESKALIAYHYGSKDGLVAAVGRELAALITRRVLARIEEARTVEAVVSGVLAAVERLATEDKRIPRLYFDLAAVSVLEPEVKATIVEINDQWREVLDRLLARASDAPPPRLVRPLTLMVIAGAQGLTLERIERGGGREYASARDLFIRAAVAAAHA